MKHFSADYIFPVAGSPVKQGVVVMDNNNTVIDLIDPTITEYGNENVKRYKGIICPGFVNTHCHLELSYLKGLIPEYTGLDGFISHLQSIRNTIPAEKILEAAAAADNEMNENGIVAVGDIANTSYSFVIKNNSLLQYHTFIEVYSSNPERADKAFAGSIELAKEISLNSRNSKYSITPHSTYSLSKKLFTLIKNHIPSVHTILSIHHQESEQENNFFKEPLSNIASCQNLFGVEKPDFANCGKRPMQAIAAFLPKTNPLLLVHNTVSEQADIDFAHQYFKNASWCLCPNSNLYIENRLPRFGLFNKNNCYVTLGTDSYASNKQLSVLEEMKTIQKESPDIPLETLINWATHNGAAFLGMASLLGSLEQGKKPGLNLITDMDITGMMLSKKSIVKRLL